MRLTLLRKERLADGVFGELLVTGERQDHLQLQTVEDDWRDNAPRISCIPTGLYVLQRTIYRKHGYETFEVMGVPGRSRILIHPANTEEDLEGCIGVGLDRGKVRVVRDEDTGEMNRLKEAVTSSRPAFHAFMKYMAGVDDAEMEVLWIGGLGPMAVAP